MPATRERAPIPDSPDERELAEEFADAFELGDMDRGVALLTEDAWVTMPPEPLEYQGHAAIGAFLRHALSPIGRATGAGWFRRAPTTSRRSPCTARTSTPMSRACSACSS